MQDSTKIAVINFVQYFIKRFGSGAQNMKLPLKLNLIINKIEFLADSYDACLYSQLMEYDSEGLQMIIAALLLLGHSYIALAVQ